MTIKELHQEIVKNVENWQKIENQSVASTAQIMEKTDNPIIRLAMEIIQRDSQTHAQVQRWIADTFKFRTVSLSPDELARIGKELEYHIALEKKMIASAERMLSDVKGKRNILAQQYFLTYLLDDERKHDRLLESLQILAGGMRDSD